MRPPLNKREKEFDDKIYQHISPYTQRLYYFFPSTYSLSNTNNLNNNINDGINKSKPKIKAITNANPISGLT